ncbi:MAG: hypothetical protein KBT29_07100 [Prevotellaceae bacterium]|nr:hypothetical protein [Candidatus Minthosoma caballi]
MPYSSPMPLLVHLVAVFVIVAFFFNYDVDGEEVMNESIYETVHSVVLTNTITFIASFFKNKVFLALAGAFLMTPVFKLMFRKQTITRYDGSKSPMNMAEHFHALVYHSSQSVLLSFFFMAVESLVPNPSSLASLEGAIRVLVFVWLYRQLFEISWLRAFFLTLGSLFLAMVCIILASIFVISIFNAFDGA